MRVVPKASLKTAALLFGVASIIGGCAAAGAGEAPAALSKTTQQSEPADFASVIHNASDVSPAARATRPDQAPDYADPRAMLENADMSAFMMEGRKMYEAGTRADSWGFAALDMLAAGQTDAVLALVEKMPPPAKRGQPLGKDWLQPWALAAAGRQDDALREMKALENVLPEILYRGHTALLLEGLGRYDEALEAYQLTKNELTLPDEDADPTDESIMQSLAFGKYRILAFREAELLRKQGRDSDAGKVYEMLLAADEDDIYASKQLEEVTDGKKLKEAELSLAQALSLALNDESNVIEERQALASIIFAKSAEAPFNHFVSALRQSALVLDPSNSGVREIEAGHLFEHGHFEAAARIALAGRATPEERTELMLAAARAYIELERFERVSALVGEVLEIDGDDGVTVLNASELLILADQGERAAELAARSRTLDLHEELVSYAYVTESEAHFQAGDVSAAIKAARAAANEDEEDDGIREFLATQLLQKPTSRAEGIEIYRDLFRQSPDNVTMMNNFGYGLINNTTSSRELDEGYRLLRRANRITPFEPNLLDSLGWAYYQYGDFERALQLIDKAVEAYEPFSHWELLDHRGDILYRLGREEEARETWREALKSRPPRHHKEQIAAKIDRGMSSPAPEKRTPPVVKSAEPVETNDI